MPFSVRISDTKVEVSTGKLLQLVARTHWLYKKRNCFIL